MSTVLVACERPALGTTVSRLLTDAGYDVLAATPRAAIAAARNHGAVHVLVTNDIDLLQGQLDVVEGRPPLRPRLPAVSAPDLDGPWPVGAGPSSPDSA